jgi:hypothetical protein
MSRSRLIEFDDDAITVEVVHDGRLKKTIRWEWNGDHVRIRAPKHVSQRQLDQQMAEIVEVVKRRRAQVRARADADLEARARRINARYFDGDLTWHSIRWVNNMEKRLGSCTHGGPTDGDIRLSSRIKNWPSWVVDYVVAHELTHRKYPNHSKTFWAYLSRYPKTERARGFIQGAAFQRGQNEDELL